MMCSPNIASVLIAERKKQGWSQEDLAKRSATRLVHIQLIEKGDIDKVRLKTLLRICSSLQLKLVLS